MIIFSCCCVHMYHGMTCCGRRRSSPSILTAGTHKLMCADCESMVLAFAVEAMLCTVYSKKLAQEDLVDVYEQDGTSDLVQVANPGQLTILVRTAFPASAELLDTQGKKPDSTCQQHNVCQSAKQSRDRKPQW